MLDTSISKSKFKRTFKNPYYTMDTGDDSLVWVGDKLCLFKAEFEEVVENQVYDKLERKDISFLMSNKFPLYKTSLVLRDIFGNLNNVYFYTGLDHKKHYVTILDKYKDLYLGYKNNIDGIGIVRNEQAIISSISIELKNSILEINNKLTFTYGSLGV